METIVYLIRHSKKMKKGFNYLDNKEDQNIKTQRMILSVEGEYLAKKFCEHKEFANVNVIYSSHYARSMATAKYLAYNLNLDINIDNRLGEILTGDLDYNQKEFDYNRFHDFNYKIENGESVNEVKNRMKLVFDDIISQNAGKKIAVFSHHLAIMCLLMNYCEVDYDAKDKIILKYNDKLNISTKWDSPDGYKIILNNNQIVSIEHI